MAITYRNCIVCKKEMRCVRGNKTICSNVCHSKLHKQAAKLGISIEAMKCKYEEDVE